MSLRVVFMGTPEFAVPPLTEIVGQGHEVVAVYTRAPKPAGRGLELTPSPVHRQAQIFGLPVLTPRTLRSDEATATFAAHRADVCVVVAYGLLLPAAILAAPGLGCLNLHASLLPRWRGAAPIQRAIMAGDAETGVMVMRMEEGLDTGPVGMVERIAIPPEATARELHDRLMPLGADLMVRALAALSRGGLSFRPQADQGITYAAKISKEEARIDWTKPDQVVHDQIRGLSPFPGAFFELAGARIKVLRSMRVSDAPEAPPGTLLDEDLTVACGSGAIRLVELQRAGKGALGAAAFQRGMPLPAGLVLS